MVNVNRMIRLYFNTHLCEGGTISVTKEQRHYLENVMRIKDNLLIFNGKDGEFLGEYEKNKIHIYKQTQTFSACPDKFLAFGLIKKHRLAWLIEKACELGVTDLFPLVCQHVQFHDFKADRYERILIEAAEQSGRLDIPTIHPVQKLPNFLEKHTTNKKWIFGSFSGTPYAEAKSPFDGCIIGPEGGFNQEEEKLLGQYATPISMGKLILRAETAALWFLSQTGI